MNTNQRIILDSPLGVPVIQELYNRIILAAPDIIELFHLALLEAQYLGTSQGKSPMIAVMEYCEHLNTDVLQEYSKLTNIPLSNVRHLFENDVVNFLIIVSKFYRNQLTFKGIAKHLLDNSKFLMLEQIVDAESKASHVIAVAKDLTYVQLSKCNSFSRLSPENDIADFP